MWFVFQISKKYILNYYPELEIWICCLLLLARNLNFKFRIVILNLFWEIWKTLSKKVIFRGGIIFQIWEFLKFIFVFRLFWQTSKSLRKNETLTSCPFFSFFYHFWVGATANPKCFNCMELACWALLVSLDLYYYQ